MLETFFPGVHGRGKPVLELDQLKDLLFQRFDLLSGKGCYATARGPAGIPLPEYSGEFGEAEARLDRAADGLNAGDCAGVV